MIKTAAQILAEIGVEDADRAVDLARPLKQPGRGGYWVRTKRYPEVRKSAPRPRRVCTLVPGCTYPHEGHGGCGRHRYRLERYGDPLGGPKPRSKLGTIEGLGGEDHDDHA